MNYRDQFRHSLERPAEFWNNQARQLAWYAPPRETLVLDEQGYGQWFHDGVLNTAYLCLDHQLLQGRGDQLALVFDSPETGVERRYTYRDLTDEVSRFAGVLRSLGVGPGDTVVIYMPLIPQTIVAMLACARLGAVHSVVFGGFAPHELAVRVDDARPKVLLTASAGKQRGRVTEYVPIVEEMLAQAKHVPDAVVVYQRPFHPTSVPDTKYCDWEALAHAAQPADAVPVRATDPLYILYTSGTTGRPKGIVRDNGGHAVALKYSMSSIYDVAPGEVFWAASDVGWVVGHSYIVYGPLLQGCTTVLYEGKPVGTPDPGAFWRVVAQHGVDVMFTAPTAIRAIKQQDPQGDYLRQYDVSRLRYLFLAGERCDVATLEWSRSLLQVPVIDHWWQTESGWPMVANMVGLERLPIKPGSATVPVCGYDVRILDPQGHECSAGQEGTVAVKLPLPPGCLTSLWRNPQRFYEAYLRPFPGYYFSGDGGYRDEDGYVFITGRMDDVINVAGHRLSTATMEEVLAGHPAVAECAVVGVNDPLKGQVPLGLVVLKAGVAIPPEELQAALVQRVREEVGPIASFKRVILTGRLPKTRSGKILRRVVRKIVDGEPFQLPSTIEDASVLDELREVLQSESPQVPLHK